MRDLGVKARPLNLNELCRCRGRIFKPPTENDRSDSTSHLYHCTLMDVSPRYASHSSHSQTIYVVVMEM